MSPLTEDLPNSTFPRIRHLGPLVLDLFHRDVRVGENWLRLFPREFEVFWRLSDEPGRYVSRMQMLSDVWRLDFEPQSNRVEVAIARIRAKLAPFGLSHIIVTDRSGAGYRIIESETHQAEPPCV